MFDSDVNELQHSSAIGRFYRAHQLLSWFVVFILIPLLLVLFYGYSVARTSLPSSDTTLVLAGVEAGANLSRNEQGVAFIEAKTDNDAFFAIGYAHAQDRLWQLEIQKRMASGRLSEIFGKASLQFDIYIRTLGIYHDAELSWDAQSEQAKASLIAYAAGINAWLATAQMLPSEFVILGVEPQPWKPVDSLAWIKMFALNMSANFQVELDHMLLSSVLSPAQQMAFNGYQDAVQPTTVSVNEPEHLDQVARFANFGTELEQQWQLGGKLVGSNAWVIAAQHSVKNKAILANDPHLALDLPSLWYVVDIKGDKLNASGMSLVGLPIVLLGKNEHIAWGATNMMADTQDLYYERFDVEKPDQVEFDGQWEAMEVMEESIGVRADFPSFLREPLAPVTVKVRRTEHGPIVSDLFGAVERPLSLRWVGNSQKDTSYSSFLALNYASDWSSFIQAMSTHIAPAMNLVYSDDHNNIGYLGVGKIPIRAVGNGQMPQQGWNRAHQWRGFIPAQEMPQGLNPAKGYYVSANNKVIGPDYPYFISLDWAEPARAERINALIEQSLADGGKLSVLDNQKIQLDLIDRQALKLLPHLLAVKTTDEKIAAMVKRMENWNGSSDKDSVAATIFFTWSYHLRSQLFADELSSQWDKRSLNRRLSYITQNTTLSQLEAALENKAINWCDNIHTSTQEDCNSIKVNALKSAYSDLNLLLGSDMDDWSWSAAHQLVFAHRPFSSIKGLDRLYERSAPNGGSQNSINVSGDSFERNSGFTQSFGAGFRQIIQFGVPAEQQWYVNSTGQSGNLLSEHYDDMIAPFVNGGYFHLSAADRHDQLLIHFTPQVAKGNK